MYTKKFYGGKRQRRPSAQRRLEYSEPPPDTETEAALQDMMNYDFSWRSRRINLTPRKQAMELLRLEEEEKAIALVGTHQEEVETEYELQGMLSDIDTSEPSDADEVLGTGMGVEVFSGEGGEDVWGEGSFTREGGRMHGRGRVSVGERAGTSGVRDELRMPTTIMVGSDANVDDETIVGGRVLLLRRGEL